MSLARSAMGRYFSGSLLTARTLLPSSCKSWPCSLNNTYCPVFGLLFFTPLKGGELSRRMVRGVGTAGEGNGPALFVAIISKSDRIPAGEMNEARLKKESGFFIGHREALKGSSGTRAEHCPRHTLLGIPGHQVPEKDRMIQSPSSASIRPV